MSIRRRRMCSYCLAGQHHQCTRPWCSCVILNGLDCHPAVTAMSLQPPVERDPWMQNLDDIMARKLNQRDVATVNRMVEDMMELSRRSGGNYPGKVKHDNEVRPANGLSHKGGVVQDHSAVPYDKSSINRVPRPS